MKEFVGEVPLDSIRETVAGALAAYSDLSDGVIEFGVDHVADLVLTPDKPNSARSTTPVTYRGESIGELAVIAFAPGDGTGDERTHELADINTGTFYPRASKVVPRSKKVFAGEVHLTLASFPNHAEAVPIAFGGSLALLGLRGQALVRLGDLGQSTTEFHRAMWGIDIAHPTATLTAGNRGMLRGVLGGRFGDPHAVYNDHDGDQGYVQVCAFMGLPNDFPSTQDVFNKLGAVEPELV